MVERQHEREHVVNVVLRRVRIIRRGDSAAQHVDELRHEVPVLWSKAVDVRATVKIDDVLISRMLFRRDGPNETAVDRALRDEVFAVQAFLSALSKSFRRSQPGAACD